MRTASKLLTLLALSTAAFAVDHGAEKSDETRSSTNCSFGKQFEESILRDLGKERAEHKSGFAVVILDTKNGEALCRSSMNGSRSFYPASTIKTLIATAVLRKVDAGEITLDTLVTINQPNAAAECRDWGCGVYGPGKKVSVRKLLTDMITISNNTATNQLIDVASKTKINETADLIHSPELRVHRKVYAHSPAEVPLPKEANTATAEGYARLYGEIVSGRDKVLKESSRKLLISILGDQRQNDRLNGSFPKDVKFHHKPGNTSRVAGDAGFFYFGKNKDKAAIIVGLQDFPSYDTLRKVGADTLALIQAHERAYER